MKPPKHLLSSQDIDKVGYQEILRRADHFVKNGISPDLCRGKVVATLFFQPSTRTMNSFQSALIRSGGGWIGVTDVNTISMGKGESFEDTIAEYATYADCIVLRHPDDDAADRAAKASSVPVINSGCGSREHAASAAFMLTMIDHFLKCPLQGAKVGLYGTPEINRLSKSLIPILGMFGVELVVDDLGHFPFPKEIEERAKANGMKSIAYDKLDNFIGDVDLLLVTRGLQKGIIPPGKFPKDKEEMILKLFRPITKADMNKMKRDGIMYMIKPLTFEVERDVDGDPHEVYTKPEPYTEAGLALFTYLLGIKV
jgi:aspartate carbamoyltransferase catalytic subunit